MLGISYANVNEKGDVLVVPHSDVVKLDTQSSHLGTRDSVNDHGREEER